MASCDPCVQFWGPVVGPTVCPTFTGCSSAPAPAPKSSGCTCKTVSCIECLHINEVPKVTHASSPMNKPQPLSVSASGGGGAGASATGSGGLTLKAPLDLSAPLSNLNADCFSGIPCWGVAAGAVILGVVILFKVF